MANTRNAIVTEARALHLEECRALVVDYDLGRPAIEHAVKHARRLAQRRRPGRPVVADCRYLVDLVDALQAAARKRTH